MNFKPETKKKKTFMLISHLDILYNNIFIHLPRGPKLISSIVQRVIESLFYNNMPNSDVELTMSWDFLINWYLALYLKYIF